MKLYSETEEYKLYQGNMLDMLENINLNSIDSIVTDPPYGLTSITKRLGKENSAPAKCGKDGAFARLSKGFMGEEWDGSGIEYNVEAWKNCFKVLKPGGYLLAFGGSRTYHKIANAIEEAGFEIRDCIMWIYGSGFPKSMNISKGIEAREKYGKANTVAKRLIEQSCEGEEYKIKQTNNGAMGKVIEATRKHYIPTTDLATRWQGWGTCLKPAYEPIIVARKPFQGSLIDNILLNNVGGLNIDGCRVPVKKGEYDIRHYTNEDCFQNKKTKTSKFKVESQPNGRFPSNLILTYNEDDYMEVCSGFPNGKKNGNITKRYKINNQVYGKYGDCNTFNAYDDVGNASRYFYCAKASKKDRDEGLDCLDNKVKVFNGKSANSSTNMKDVEKRFTTVCKNTHPTVKPTTLMQYLIRLVTPKDGIILDPFLGSGSTGKAAMYENFEKDANYKFIGIELSDEYLYISNLRIKYVCDMKKNNRQLKLNI